MKISDINRNNNYPQGALEYPSPLCQQREPATNTLHTKHKANSNNKNTRKPPPHFKSSQSSTRLVQFHPGRESACEQSCPIQVTTVRSLTPQTSKCFVPLTLTQCHRVANTQMLMAATTPEGRRSPSRMPRENSRPKCTKLSHK